INPITGEKVGEGKPTEKITKEPIDQVVEYGPNKEYPSNPIQPSNPDKPQGTDNIDNGFNHDDNGNPIQPSNDMTHQNNSSKTNNKSESKNNEKQLPDTGNNDHNEGTLIGSLLAIIGSLFVFGRRKNKQSTEK
ncbi:LPXTG cell wall anchor domain-containing protein, partial [Staphylococcus capitis]